MGSISCALARIKQQLEVLVPESFIVQSMKTLGIKWRQRKVSPAMNVYLLLLQFLASSTFERLRHVAGLAITPQGLCQARKRLPLKLLMAIVAQLGSVPRDLAPRQLFYGLRVLLVDGMSFSVPDTPALAAKYGRTKNQRGISRCYPAPKLLALLDVASGMIYKVIPLPWKRQERTCLTRLCGMLQKGDLILGDRGLIGFVQFAQLINRGLNVLMRLPRDCVVHKRGRASHHLLRRLGKQDLLVTWSKPRKRRWLGTQRFAKLPADIQLRQICFRILRPGYRTHWAWIITTLTDPAVYPAQDLVDLYAKRWQVEVYFRDLKQSLHFKQLTAKSVNGIRKQILGMVLLYNLIRQIISTAALAMKVDPDRVSFKDAMDWLLWATSPNPADLIVRKQRKRPTQPRRIKRFRKRFLHLCQPRETYVKPRPEFAI